MVFSWILFQNPPVVVIVQLVDIGWLTAAAISWWNVPPQVDAPGVMLIYKWEEIFAHMRIDAPLVQFQLDHLTRLWKRGMQEARGKATSAHHTKEWSLQSSRQALHFCNPPANHNQTPLSHQNGPGPPGIFLTGDWDEKNNESYVSIPILKDIEKREWTLHLHQNCWAAWSLLWSKCSHLDLRRTPALRNRHYSLEIKNFQFSHFEDWRSLYIYMFRFFTVTCVVLKRFAKGSVEEGADGSRLKK